jgi:hypothetical protein
MEPSVIDVLVCSRQEKINEQNENFKDDTSLNLKRSALFQTYVDACRNISNVELTMFLRRKNVCGPKMKPLNPLHVLEIPTSRRGRIELLMNARYPVAELREAGKLFLLEKTMC